MALDDLKREVEKHFYDKQSTILGGKMTVSYAPEIGEIIDHLHAQGRILPDGFVAVPRELTAENGAKHALIGEFSEVNNDGSKTFVSWSTIKEIHRAVVRVFGTAAQKGDK